jgi:hypothetical protein
VGLLALPKKDKIDPWRLKINEVLMIFDDLKI